MKNLILQKRKEKIMLKLMNIEIRKYFFNKYIKNKKCSLFVIKNNAIHNRTVIRKLKVYNLRKSKFIKISCKLKRNILRMFKILLCQKFTYNFENCIITFDNKVNNNKDFNRIKNLCYYYDVNFKYINNYQIELIY